MSPCKQDEYYIQPSYLPRRDKENDALMQILDFISDYTLLHCTPSMINLPCFHTVLYAFFFCYTTLVLAILEAFLTPCDPRYHVTKTLPVVRIGAHKWHEILQNSWNHCSPSKGSSLVHVFLTLNL